jgi:putative ABC transport system permease protein
MNGLERVALILSAARQAVRGLSKRPAFTLPVLLTLTLAIAAAVVAFTVVDNVLLKPLPYPQQDALVDVAHEAPALGLAELGASPAIYFTYRDHNESFTAIGLWDSDDSPATVTGAGEPQTVTALGVTHEVLPLLGTAALRGRVFAAADDEPGAAPTVILSHGYWQRRFGGADVLGRTLDVQGVTRQIVGVLPPAFRFFDYEADILYPLQPQRTNAAFGSFDGRAIARLRDGVTLEQASADVRRMIPILAAEFPPVRASFASSGFAPNLRSLKDSVVRDLGETLWVLFGTTAILLLVACASVANLVLLRNDARRHEVAIRMALGAGTARIGRLVAAEGIVLALAAGALGLLLAAACLPLVLASSAEWLPGVMAVRLDARVASFALALAVVAGLVLSLAPALRLLRSSLVDALHRGAGALTVGRERHRVRHALVVAQVALAVLLLIGSGLMWRTFAALRDVPPGFDDPAAIQTFRVTLPSAGDAEQTVRAQQTIAERLSAVSGVQSAAFASFDDGLPLDGDGRSSTVEIEARERAAGSDPVREIQVVSPGFMETLRTPLVIGRTFDWTDVFASRPVAVVSENMALEEWGSPAAALGRRIRVSPNAPWVEIVGVVQAVRHDGLDRPAPGTVTLPLQTGGVLPPVPTATFVVRSERVGSAGFVRELERAVWAEQPAVSLLNLQTLGELYRRSLARTALTLQLLGTMATIAMLLGLVGVYGSISYAVAQRRRELGIRRALGAPDGTVRRQFVLQAVVLAAAGVVGGIAASAALSQALSSQLYGVSPLDPLTYAVVALGLIAAAAVASYVPARRAVAVDPMEVLRAE